MAVVVDASLVIPLAARDHRAETASRLLRSWIGAGEALHAPALALYEIASGLTRLVVAGRFLRAELGAAIAKIAALPIDFHPLTDIPDVAELALTLGRRSAYDAAYVFLAIQLEADLWTFDRPLVRNATEHGLPVKLAA